MAAPLSPPIGNGQQLPLHSLSPIQRLPIEIGSMIFRYYASEEAREAGHANPLTLGAVCKRWREIAWTTREIWTFLYVHVSLFKSRSWSTFYKLVAEWLSRCANRPLNIHLHCYPRNYYKEKTTGYEFSNGLPLVTLVNGYSGQWHTLDIQIPDVLMPYLDSSSCTPSNLSQLLMAIPNDGDFLPPTISPPIANLRPRVVQICCFYLGIQTQFFAQFWACVTRLRLVNLSVEYLYTIIFPNAPNLREFVFEGAIFKSEEALAPAPSTGTVSHPQLESLEIEFADSEAECLFMDAFILPGLKVLRISYVEDYIKLHPDCLDGFLTRSSCHLRTMEFPPLIYDSEEDDWIDMLTTLGSIQTLEKLNISADQHPGFMDSLSDLLDAHLPSDDETTPAHPAPLFPSPRLFSWSGSECFPWETIPSFFAPLHPHDSDVRRPLQKVQVHCRPRAGKSIEHVPADVISELLRFVGEVEFDFTVDPGRDGPSQDWWKLSVAKFLK